MRFEWDDEKNASNFRKHGVRFEVATAVFDDPMHLMAEDRVIDGEVRWRSIGVAGERYLLLVIHTFVEEGEEIVRIISAREATRHERREYESGL